MMEIKEQLYNMPVGAMIRIEEDRESGVYTTWLITRVPGGWVYKSQDGGYASSAVFVPYIAAGCT